MPTKHLSHTTSFHCMLVLLTLVAGLASSHSVVAGQEEIPGTQPPRTINVEIVIDASGSMAAQTDTGELRITAAQRVLQDVVNSIPETEGINVGLRVYGHQGDNTDEGRPASCASTELLVPVDGVDKSALSSAISSIQPVGWTPLGLAIETAGEDFTEPATDKTVNAIVLVTDGLETCDGDPVQAATALRGGDIGVITHVIGFGTTGEELAILNGIASAGDGQLLGAQNAQQLNAALFSILEQLEIVVGAGFVGGNAFDILPPATLGEVSVIGFGSGSYGSYPIVARNDTGQDISAVKVTVTIRDAGGALLANGDVGQGLTPSYVRAGGVAIGSVYLGPDLVIPEGAQIDFDVSFSPAALISPFQPLDMDMIEANQFDNRIVGTLANGHEVSGELGVRITAVCFDLNGTPLSVDHAYIDRQTIAPGETASFQVDLLGAFLGIPCPSFLVAGSANMPGSIPAGDNLAIQPTQSATAESNVTPSTPEVVAGNEQASASPVAKVVESETLAEPPTYPLPTQDPALANTYTAVAGIENAVARSYESPSDLGLWIVAVTADFDSSENARAAVPIYVDRNDTRNLQNPDIPTTLERIDIPLPDGFDSAIATVFTRDLGGGTFQYISSITVSRGDRLYSLERTRYQPGFDESVVELLGQYVLNPLPRETATDEITYGLWGELPILDEVPVGFVLASELGNYVPRSFGPIPPA